ncbi:MAG TPA: dihydrofolate reductase family protein [Kofleriaceae bacterium]|nr:dihydrofolate reductase family protein [Kofleriaceae bacterium]
MAGRIRVFIACSLDGFIAGEDDDLSWLPPPGADDHGYGAFMAEVGALLVGRRTYDVATSFEAWPYGERAVLVATTRPLLPAVTSVRAVHGPIGAMVADARAAAGAGDVYLDGGDLIRQALDADLIDELTLTIVPVILGGGAPLFAGVAHRRHLELAGERVTGGLVQLTLRPRT